MKKSVLNFLMFFGPYTVLAANSAAESAAQSNPIRISSQFPGSQGYYYSTGADYELEYITIDNNPQLTKSINLHTQGLNGNEIKSINFLINLSGKTYYSYRNLEHLDPIYKVASILVPMIEARFVELPTILTISAHYCTTINGCKASSSSAVLAGRLSYTGAVNFAPRPPKKYFIGNIYSNGIKTNLKRLCFTTSDIDPSEVRNYTVNLEQRIKFSLGWESVRSTISLSSAYEPSSQAFSDDPAYIHTSEYNCVSAIIPLRTDYILNITDNYRVIIRGFKPSGAQISGSAYEYFNLSELDNNRIDL